MPDEKVSLTQSTPSATPQPGEAGYMPPAATVPLPSLGKVYAPGSPLSGVETFQIRAMTARDEDILTSRGLLKSGRALDTLLKSCILDRSIDVDSMLAGDRNAALVAIRITGYGQQYKVKVNCPACDAAVEHEFDLSVLPVKRLGADPVQPGVNEFLFHLSVCNKDVTFKLLTGADERELSTILERTKKAGSGIDGLVTTRLLQQIVSIGGEKDRSKLAGIIRNLSARDSRDLRTFMDKVSPGVEMKQSLACNACGEESEVDVPMGTEFFWPGS